MMYDCLLIGGGPASLSAAVYLGRANYKIAFFENKAPGGKVVNTADVENYLGCNGISGPSLAFEFYDHAIKAGATYIGEKVEKIEKLTDGIFHLKTNWNEYKAKSVVIATGTVERELNVPGEKEYKNKGVSRCAICDAPLYKNQIMTFIGGGVAAIGEALHVINFAKQINLIHRRDIFKADKVLVDKLFANKKVKPYIFYNVIEIIGDKTKVTGIRIENSKTKKIIQVETQIVFPYIGSVPNTSILINSNLDYLLNDEKYIKTNQFLETKVKGLFAAGDVIEKNMRQIATAVGDGATVSRSVIAYLEE